MQSVRIYVVIVKDKTIKHLLNLLFAPGIQHQWSLSYPPSHIITCRWLIVLHDMFVYTGATLTVIVGLDDRWAILISAGVAILYTIGGGLYSVVLTDVFQLLCTTGGLVGVSMIFHVSVRKEGESLVKYTYIYNNGISKTIVSAWETINKTAVRSLSWWQLQYKHSHIYN